MFKTNGSSKIYLVEFDKGDITKADLVNIKYICQHRIKWEAHKKTNRGPTLCRNCGMFGHGLTHCHRIATCILCSDKHRADDCPLLKNANNLHPIFKCLNCVANKLPHNHRSDSSDCPSRKIYIEFRSASSSKNSKPKNVNKHSTNSSSASPTRSKSSPQSIPVQASLSYANATKAGPKPSHSQSNDLFSFEEISNILLQSLDELQKCQTKFDQLRVIANILQNVCK